MSRPRVSTLAGAAITMLLTGLAGGGVAIVRTLPAVDLEAAGLGWTVTALAAALAAAAAIATVTWVVRTLADGMSSAVLSAAAAGALVGAGVVVIVGSGSPAIPVAGAAAFLLVAVAVNRAGRPVIVQRRSRLAAVGLGLLVSELLAVAGALGVGVAAIGLADPILLAGAGFALVTLLVCLTRPSATEAAALLVGIGTLAIGRTGAAEIPIGFAFIAAGSLLLARRGVASDEPAGAAAVDEDRLPELAARLSDAVLRFDGRLRLADWNATAATLLGLDADSSGARLEDLLGIPISALPAHDTMITAERGVGGFDIAIHRSGGGLTAIIRDPSRAPETERLGRELRGTLEELVQARRTIELQRAEIERGTRIDPLTGLPSRTAILERLQLEIDEANRYRHPIAVVLLDLDRFTALNREHGTAAGDAVLREIALRMRLRVRVADALGRLGGDGFLAILPHTDDGGAATFADALRRRLTARPVAVGTTQIEVSLSAGVATMRSGEGLDVDALLGRVEEAYASAREAGGNRVALDRLHGLARLEDHRTTDPDPDAHDAADRVDR